MKLWRWLMLSGRKSSNAFIVEIFDIDKTFFPIYSRDCAGNVSPLGSD